jgi:thioredoxin
MTEQVIEVTDDTFEKEILQSSQPVLVDFYAPWCGPCRALAPIIEKLAVTYQGDARVLKLNVDDNASTSQRLGVKGIPTLILFKSGQEAERIVGAASAKALADMLDRHTDGAIAA